ncbi:recombinase family protein [Kitasatospora sp. NPDC054939]
MPDIDDDFVPAIGYIRVSTAREEMISPELQRASIEAWAERRRRRIVHWVVDLDATGRNFRRKIMKAIGYIEDGTAKEIAAWKYNRFGRQRHGNAVNLERLERAGGQLASATEEVDARTAIGRFQRGMLLELAAFESDRAGEQWKETHEWRRKQGLPSGGGKRFGYIWHPRKIPQPDGTFLLQREHYELDPATAPALAELYQRYVDGTGFRLLAKSLNDANLLTTRDMPWWDETLRNYMDSGFAAARLRVHSKDCQCEPYLGNCPNHELVKVYDESVLPPIISDGLWEQYLERREVIKATPPRARRPRSPFSRLARCALCRGVVVKQDIGIYSYVRCNTRRRRGTEWCPGVNLPYPKLETGVRQWLQQVVDEINEEADRQPTGHGVLAPSEGAGREALVQKIEKLERAAIRHMRAYALLDEEEDGTLEAEYKATLAQLRKEKAEAAAQLAELTNAGAVASKKTTARDAAPAVALGLLEEWDSLPVEHLNALLCKVIREILVTADREVVVVPTWADDAVVDQA